MDKVKHIDTTEIPMENTDDHATLPRPSFESLTDLNVYPCFLPEDHCIDHIKNWIDVAQESIIVQAYSFSSKTIGDALIDSIKRGVSVQILIDKDAPEKLNSYLQELKDSGIEVRIDQQKGRAHNKVIMIDDKNVITGSYNFTDEEYYHDSDTVVFIKDFCVYKKFRDNYEELNKSQSKRIDTQPRNIESYLQFFPYSDYYLSIHDDDIFNCRGCNVPYMKPFFDISLENTGYDGNTKVNMHNAKQKQKSENYVDVNVCFTTLPNQDCIKMIADYIINAEQSIFIQACSLTHKVILDALIDARKKNINIKLLIDKKAFKDKGQKVRDIINSGIEVRNDATCPVGIAHSKTIIIDDDLVLTGSLNLTNSAQNYNQENVLRMINTIVNSKFKEKFSAKWDAAEPQIKEL